MGGFAEFALAEPDLGETLAYRERYEAETESGPAPESARPPMGLSAAELRGWSDEAVRARVSTEAYKRTVDWETGGPSYYQKKLSMPTWPGASSGLTIGVGYDLGYHTPDEIRDAWGAHLSAANLARLLKVAGFKTDGRKASREAQIAEAKQLVEAMKDIRIPWELAEVVFVRSTLPKYARLVLAHVANAANLHPHAFGSLFSLTFNRGASFQRAGDRYAEMRAIATDMAEQKLDRIGDHIVAMKRHWANGPRGLLVRRDGEADLFKMGLAEAGKSRIASAPTAIESSASLAGEEFEDLPIDDAATESAPERPLPESYRGPRYQPEDVKWPASDDAAADYRHITDRALAGKPFKLTADDIELIIRANRFSPLRETKRIVFGLRGARLEGERAQPDVAELRLADCRPNHRDFRCVIGVLDLETRKLSGFPASTVPNANAVHTGWRLAASGSVTMRGNLLTTGCYPYVVGAHGKRQVPGCLLQGTSALEADRATVLVLRSLKDVGYGLDDFWHVCKPHDNLHPGFLDKGFSSEGCQTVRGQWASGSVTGDFAGFKKALGKPGTTGGGTRFDYVLVTGLEAAVAANLRDRGLAGDPVIVDEQLGRLRQGSTGPEVAVLQCALKRPETGTLDARDRKALVELQMERDLPTDGIYSPALDRRLGLGVFARARPTAPAQVASAGIDTAVAAPMAALVGSSADSLLYEIGRQAQMAAAASAGPAGAALEFGFADVLTAGKRLAGWAEDELKRILCGQEAEDVKVRQALAKAIAGMGKKAASAGGAPPVSVSNTGAASPVPDLAQAVSALLTERLGMLPRVAQPAAAYLVQRLAATTLDETCRSWRAAKAAARDGAAATEAATLMVAGPLDAASVRRYLAQSEDQLLVEMGRNANIAGMGATGPADAYAAAPEAFEIPDFAKNLGQSILGRLEGEVHALVCGDDTARSELRQQIASAIGLQSADRAVAVAALAGTIIAQLAVIPAVAVPLAVLLVTKFLDKGVTAGCQAWAQRLGISVRQGEAAESVLVDGKPTPAAYYLFASDVLPVADISKAAREHSRIMVGFDAGNIPRSGPIEVEAFHVARKVGAELQIYVEGPGGPTGSSWARDEIERIAKAAASVGIDATQPNWRRNHWDTGGWRSFTLKQLADYKQQGFQSAEIDNIGRVIDDVDGLIAFYKQYDEECRSGRLPQLIMKNVGAEDVEAIVRAVESKSLRRELFSEFHICETSCGYDTRKIDAVTRRIGIRTLESRNTFKYAARGLFGYQAEFDAAQRGSASPATTA